MRYLQTFSNFEPMATSLDRPLQRAAVDSGGFEASTP
jgi:hypothetical protein